MDQISGTTAAAAPTQTRDDSSSADPAASGAGSAGEQSGFGSRGRARRRARFLRKARELAYRDLGGLVFNLHRFGQRNDELVLAKLTTLGHIDAELRTIEAALQEREPVTVLREAGVTACPRCAAIHSSEDRFCPNCGLSMSRRVDLPIAGPAAASPPSTPASPPSAPASPAQAPTGQQAASPPTAAAPIAASPPASTAPPPEPRPGGQRVSGGAPATPPSSPASSPGAPSVEPTSVSPGEEESTEIIRPGAPRS